MKLELTVDPRIANKLREAVKIDAHLLRQGPFQAITILSYYANAMILTTTSGYNDGEPAAQGNLKIPTREILEEVVEGTWLAHRDDQPGTPNAAIIILDPTDTDLVVTYYTGDDALQWDIQDDGINAFRERLRPPSITPPDDSGE